MTYGDVMICIEGYNGRQLDEWRRTRMVTHMIYCSIPEKGTARKKSIDSFMPLPGDEGYSENSFSSHDDRVARVNAFKEKDSG